MKNRDVFVKSNSEGVNKVTNENYAFLMESTSLEYEVQQNCNLTQIGGVLGSKGYGIALQKSETLSSPFVWTNTNCRIRMDGSNLPPNPTLPKKRDHRNEKDQMVALQRSCMCRRRLSIKAAANLAQLVQRFRAFPNPICRPIVFGNNSDDRVLYKEQRNCSTRQSKKCSESHSQISFRNPFLLNWFENWF